MCLVWLLTCCFIIWGLSPSSAATQDSVTLSTTPTAWTHCLHHHAQKLDLHPALLRAIIYAESRNHPFAIGWTDETGSRHSQFPPTEQAAHRLMQTLRQRGQQFDAGLGQISSTNHRTIAVTLGIQPEQLFEPCRNLTAASHILHEQILRHGKTWQALAGYNGSVGSTKYIATVHGHLCRQTPSLCRGSRFLWSLPLPDTPLPSATAFEASIYEHTSDDAGPDLSFADLRPSRIPHRAATLSNLDPIKAIVHIGHTLPSPSTMVMLGVQILLPLLFLITLLIVCTYAIRTLLWSYRLVRDSIQALHRPSPLAFRRTSSDDERGRSTLSAHRSQTQEQSLQRPAARVA
jgi:hypothetical protein